MWKLQRDKSGNGYAVIRFLPVPFENGTNDAPWNRYWDHGFQDETTGQWYIERSLTSLGLEDPVGKLNNQLWNTGNKTLATHQKRRLHYVSNILVISDPANPQNEGKVMLFEYGKKIFEKVMDAIKPQFPDEQAVDVFDMDKGANFNLKARIVDGWVNYDKSSWDNPTSIGDEKFQEEIYDQLVDLYEFTDPNDKGYKTYPELEARLNQVTGRGTGTPELTAAQRAALGTPTQAPSAGKQSEASEPTGPVDFEKASADMDENKDKKEEGDVLDYFAKMAAES